MNPTTAVLSGPRSRETHQVWFLDLKPAQNLRTDNTCLKLATAEIGNVLGYNKHPRTDFNTKTGALPVMNLVLMTSSKHLINIPQNLRPNENHHDNLVSPLVQSQQDTTIETLSTHMKWEKNNQEYISKIVYKMLTNDN
jgi:hypothetical protein